MHAFVQSIVIRYPVVDCEGQNDCGRGLLTMSGSWYQQTGTRVVRTLDHSKYLHLELVIIPMRSSMCNVHRINLSS
jgi:hypothetical protein